jgi:hypothetical protein
VPQWPIMQFIIRGFGKTNNRLVVIHRSLITDRSITIPALTSVCVKPAFFANVQVSAFRKAGTKATFGPKLVGGVPHATTQVLVAERWHESLALAHSARPLRCAREFSVRPTRAAARWSRPRPNVDSIQRGALLPQRTVWRTESPPVDHAFWRLDTCGVRFFWPAVSSL